MAFPQYRESGESCEGGSYVKSTPSHGDLSNDTAFTFLGRCVKEKVKKVTEKVVLHDLTLF